MEENTIERQNFIDLIIIIIISPVYVTGLLSPSREKHENTENSLEI